MPNLFPTVIVGLGNPGKQYQQTRHNIGYLAVDRLREKIPTHFDRSKNIKFGILWTASFAGKKLFVVRPNTYMNLSGKSIHNLVRFKNFSIDQILVVSDDLDLPLGKIRIRPEGGSGGHRGLESIISELCTKSFGRLRVGIKSFSREESTSNFVLSKFKDSEIPILNTVLEHTVDAIILSITHGTDSSMNKYNGANLQIN